MSIDVLQRKIKTTGDLREIVNNMKTLSSVSILQYEQANRVLEKYQHNLKDAFHALAMHNGVPKIITQKTARSRHLFIVIGSDNGMVGRFNREMVEKTKQFLQDNHILAQSADFITIGKRIFSLAEHQHWHVVTPFAGANSVKAVNSLAEQVIIKLEETVRKYKVSNIYICGHWRFSGGKIEMYVNKILPVEEEQLKKLRQKKWETNNIPLLPLENSKMFTALLFEMLTIGIAKSINSSLAAEHYTRMTNMQNAQKNINENLEELNLQFQQERQTEITNELIDVISGANAIEDEKK